MTAGTPRLRRPPAPLPGWPRGEDVPYPREDRDGDFKGCARSQPALGEAVGTFGDKLGVSARAGRRGLRGERCCHTSAPSFIPIRVLPTRQTPLLKGHVEFCDQEIDVVLFLQLEGLGDDAGGLPVLFPSQPCAVHLQNDVSHLQLPAVVCRAPPLQEREGSAHVPTTLCIKQGGKNSYLT